MPERVRRIAEYRRRSELAGRLADAALDDEEEAAFLQLASQLLRQAEALEATLHADGILITPHDDNRALTDAKLAHGDTGSESAAGKRAPVDGGDLS